MPILTPVFGLSYPGPNDAPCDFAEQWCEFSDTFQAALDPFQAIIDRTEPAVPMAQLRLTETIVMNTGFVPFDTLAVDTAGWVDFDADNTGITTDRGGYFTVVAGATVSSSLLGVIFGISTSSFVAMADNKIDQGTANTVVGMGFSGNRFLTTPETFRLQVSRSPNTVAITVLQAQLTVFWHSDRATP